jgi:hypothetical protein
VASKLTSVRVPAIGCTYQEHASPVGTVDFHITILHTTRKPYAWPHTKRPRKNLKVPTPSDSLCALRRDWFFHSMISLIITSSSLIYCPPAAAFSAASLASIFLLAARIMSSLLFLSSACRSSLFALQPAAVSFSCDAAVASTRSRRLYRVMRSGCDAFSEDFDCCVCVGAGDAVRGRGGGWKLEGGCDIHETS